MERNDQWRRGRWYLVVLVPQPICLLILVDRWRNAVQPLPSANDLDVTNMIIVDEVWTNSVAYDDAVRHWQCLMCEDDVEGESIGYNMSQQSIYPCMAVHGLTPLLSQNAMNSKSSKWDGLENYHLWSMCAELNNSSKTSLVPTNAITSIARLQLSLEQTMQSQRWSLHHGQDPGELFVSCTLPSSMVKLLGELEHGPDRMHEYRLHPKIQQWNVCDATRWQQQICMFSIVMFTCPCWGSVVTVWHSTVVLRRCFSPVLWSSMKKQGTVTCSSNLFFILWHGSKVRSGVTTWCHDCQRFTGFLYVDTHIQL